MSGANSFFFRYKNATTRKIIIQTHILGSVMHVPKKPSAGMSRKAETNFKPISIQLERIGTTFFPMLCMAVRRTSKTPKTGKNPMCQRKLMTAFDMI